MTINEKYKKDIFNRPIDDLELSYRTENHLIGDDIKFVGDLVKLDKKDPNELGYEKITEKIQDTYQFSFEELMQMEINSLWK